MSEIKAELLYTKEHEWLKVDGDLVTIGITDFAQSSLGDIVFVELPEAETQYSANETFGVVESIKSVSDLYTPVSGLVLEKNENVESSPEDLNSKPYDSWLIKVKLSNIDELNSLMSSEQYKEFCDQNS